MTTTTKSAADELREAFRVMGWTRRMVSVRADYFSMGSSLSVTIRDPRVNAGAAERIARRAERVARCEMTGEILSGGNRHVDVGHTPECKAILARRHADAIAEACDVIDVAPADARNILHTITDAYAVTGGDREPYQVWPRVDGAGRSACRYQFDRAMLDEIAYRIALGDPDQQ